MAGSDRRERRWQISNPGNAAIRKEVVGAALAAAADPIAGDGEVLDAGCGQGWWMRQLTAAGVAPERIQGIDLDAPSIAEAERVVPRVSVQVGDVRTLPYDDERFSVVFAMLVLSTLPSAADVRRTVGEFRRVLVPGGTFIVWDPRVWTSRRDTRIVRAGELGENVESQTLTLLPPLARRLGRTAPRLYGPLASIPPLRTHRLYVGRR